MGFARRSTSANLPIFVPEDAPAQRAGLKYLGRASAVVGDKVAVDLSDSDKNQNTEVTLPQGQGKDVFRGQTVWLNQQSSRHVLVDFPIDASLRVSFHPAYVDSHVIIAAPTGEKSLVSGSTRWEGSIDGQGGEMNAMIVLMDEKRAIVYSSPKRVGPVFVVLDSYRPMPDGTSEPIYKSVFAPITWNEPVRRKALAEAAYLAVVVAGSSTDSASLLARAPSLAQPLKMIDGTVPDASLVQRRQ